MLELLGDGLIGVAVVGDPFPRRLSHHAMTPTTINKAAMPQAMPTIRSICKFPPIGEEIDCSAVNKVVGIVDDACPVAPIVPSVPDVPVPVASIVAVVPVPSLGVAVVVPCPIASSVAPAAPVVVVAAAAVSLVDNGVFPTVTFVVVVVSGAVVDDVVPNAAVWPTTSSSASPTAIRNSVQFSHNRAMRKISPNDIASVRIEPFNDPSVDISV